MLLWSFVSGSYTPFQRLQNNANGTLLLLKVCYYCCWAVKQQRDLIKIDRDYASDCFSCKAFAFLRQGNFFLSPQRNFSWHYLLVGISIIRRAAVAQLPFEVFVYRVLA